MDMKKLRSRTFQNVRKITPKWSEFKDIVQRYPESIAYSAIAVPSLTMGAQNLAKSPDQAKMCFAGFLMSSVCAVGSLLREEIPLNKSEKRASTVIGITGFVIGAATILTGAATLGLEIGIMGAVGAFFYKPIKDTVKNALHKK